MNHGMAIIDGGHLFSLNYWIHYIPPQFYPINLEYLSCKYIPLIRLETSVDRYHMASPEASLSKSTVVFK